MSDSEEETRERTSVGQKRDSKYQCPAEFISFSYDSSVNALCGDKQELWFIKAPARFEPECFDNLTLPLSGLEMVQSNGNSPQIYSVVSGGTMPSDLHLLISKGENQKLSLCSSSFSGVLKISESYGNCGENQDLIPVPAAPAPRIPDGLKQRFQPFGSSAGAHIQKEVASPAPPQKTRQDLGDGEEPKKKKKKKKDKRQEEGDSEDVFIKQEETQIECDQLELSELMEEEPMEERRRKKKKVKKEKERESPDMVDASLLLKTEQLDPSYDNTEVTPGKTKKKKKKSSRNE